MEIWKIWKFDLEIFPDQISPLSQGEFPASGIDFYGRNVSVSCRELTQQLGFHVKETFQHRAHPVEAVSRRILSRKFFYI